MIVLAIILSILIFILGGDTLFTKNRLKLTFDVILLFIFIFVMMINAVIYVID